MKSHQHEFTTPPVAEVHPDSLLVSSGGVPKEESQSKMSEHESLKALIEKNIKWSQVIYNQNRKIQGRLSWMVFGSYFRLFLILVPIIVGIIFLPPLISDFMKQYGSSLSGSQQNLKEYLEIFRSLKQ